MIGSEDVRIKGKAVPSGRERELTAKRRLFLGIELPASIKVSVQALSQPAVQKIKKGRLTNPENYHLTVYFIGEADEEQRQRWEACGAYAAKSSHPFELELRDTGAFVKRNRMILWFGSRGSAQLEALYRNVLETAEALGLLDLSVRQDLSVTAHKPFTPHVTLGREVVADREAVLISTRTLRFMVKHLTLFESRRTSTGLVYMPLARFPLSVSPPDESEDQEIL